MESGGIPVLTAISDSRQAIATTDEDLRGQKVTDRSGNEFGKVADLLVYEEEHKVRFLVTEQWWFLGIGEKKSYVPVDAVADVTEDRVRIERTREQVVGLPEYDLELVDRNAFYDRVYQHYGYAPFWGTGYVHPPFPRLPGQP